MKKIVYNLFLQVLILFVLNKVILGSSVITVNGNFNASQNEVFLYNKYLPYDTIFFNDTIPNFELNYEVKNFRTILPKGIKFFIPTVSGQYFLYYKDLENSTINYVNSFLVLPYKINIVLEGRDSVCQGNDLMLKYTISGINPVGNFSVLGFVQSDNANNRFEYLPNNKIRIKTFDNITTYTSQIFSNDKKFNKMHFYVDSINSNKETIKRGSFIFEDFTIFNNTNISIISNLFGPYCFDSNNLYEIKSLGFKNINKVSWYKNNQLTTIASSLIYRENKLNRMDQLKAIVIGERECDLTNVTLTSNIVTVLGFPKQESTLSISGFYNICDNSVKLNHSIVGYSIGKGQYTQEIISWYSNNSILGVGDSLSYVPYKSLRELNIYAKRTFSPYKDDCALNLTITSNNLRLKIFPEDCPFAILTSAGNTLKVVKRDGSPYLGNYKLYKDTTFVADFTGQIATSVSGSYFVEYLDCICEATLLRSDAYSFIYNPLITNSIDQHNQNEIEIYPNPSQGFFYIKNAEMVKVYDLLGNFVTQSENETLVLASKGIYLAEIITKFSKTYQKLIVK